MQDGTKKFLFFDEFEHSLDVQRRFAVPSEWRYAGTDSSYVITIGREGVLQMYTSEMYDEMIYSKLKKMSPANAKEARQLSMLGRKTWSGTCDKQGRIQLPQKLLDYAGLKVEDKICLNGSVLYAEILAPKRHIERQGDAGDEECLDLLERLHDGDGK